MKEDKISLSMNCHFVRADYGGGIFDVTLEYTEHSPDPWYGNSETEVDIDAGRAQEIIDFLRWSFDI